MTRIKLFVFKLFGALFIISGILYIAGLLFFIFFYIVEDLSLSDRLKFLVHNYCFPFGIILIVGVYKIILGIECLRNKFMRFTIMLALIGIIDFMLGYLFIINFVSIPVFLIYWIILYPVFLIYINSREVEPA
jgi:hypothetical protein